MKKTLNWLTNVEFQSSSSATPQFLQFFRDFKSELNKVLKTNGCTDIKIGKGHFYASGFFTHPNGQIYYFSISDPRMRTSNPRLLFRTAKSYTDYTGGFNQYVEFKEINSWRIFN